ncbi:hypothetical protein [Streptomyces sp. NPDC088762]|uniref:hypothetical protein n=1 Tax=Streptomyces sp. NPDC088762 TaxID=3365891 RepID=UPI003803D29C
MPQVLPLGVAVSALPVAVEDGPAIRLSGCLPGPKARGGAAPGAVGVVFSG